ncbi:hypothetical protein DL767_008382 [Monosporascus sp. MG133]|nr:hypothetical protein DL767_008382 [Monosporascus sp. MG133]
MALSQNREGNFNPTSPHSSSGVADSFKGTPDTRLTAFSPEDGSARPPKVPGSLNLIGREATQARYPVSSPSSFDHSKKFYRADLHLERDPFITSSDPTVKPTPKLSPTATSFFPLKAQLGFRTSASELDYSTREATREPNYTYEPTITRLHAAEDRDLPYIKRRGWGAVTCHEGQIYLTVFPHGVNLPNDLKQLEMIVKNVLQGEGDLFAFKLQPGVEGSLFSALIEYCDNDMSLNAVSHLNGTVVNIMLRNIPNKVDQEMLKDIVDQSSKGKYDFMYLRIDFANDCNVGYAFINFVDPLDIIDFVNARGNKRWNCFKSDKVAEISYATIQGKDCLVQKFRNSSLFYTVNGPHPEMAGKEEPFPGPDNQSKMKRSCENAEHVGLFTPNAGQHFRDEQRRRRSQFDRGTRLAALEEFDQDLAIHHNLYSLQ